jgi:hypothetical protein
MTREEILTATPEWLNEQSCLYMGMVPGIPETGPWNPAEDIRDAWTLVDSMRKDGAYLSLNYRAGIFPEICEKLGWIAKFRFLGAHAIGETAPEAICKAFLLACLEVKK